MPEARYTPNLQIPVPGDEDNPDLPVHAGRIADRIDLIVSQKAVEVNDSTLLSNYPTATLLAWWPSTNQSNYEWNTAGGTTWTPWMMTAFPNGPGFVGGSPRVYRMPDTSFNHPGGSSWQLCFDLGPYINGPTGSAWIIGVSATIITGSSDFQVCAAFTGNTAGGPWLRIFGGGGGHTLSNTAPIWCDPGTHRLGLWALSVPSTVYILQGTTVWVTPVGVYKGYS